MDLLGEMLFILMHLHIFHPTTMTHLLVFFLHLLMLCILLVFISDVVLGFYDHRQNLQH